MFEIWALIFVKIYPQNQEKVPKSRSVTSPGVIPGTVPPTIPIVIPFTPYHYALKSISLCLAMAALKSLFAAILRAIS